MRPLIAVILVCSLLVSVSCTKEDDSFRQSISKPKQIIDSIKVKPTVTPVNDTAATIHPITS